ncbi:hypothetical protein Clacol_009562 [Clathrus columnatus]|uniref:Carboxylesterase type B domain-containing protein n=1 Tax=Clathrus columnatus TaxID=1419009 RepID=A0AAV5AKU4_9AGAM|nr:hypothetical protein Clacol_009562 [Clathrus columnatus]
MVSVYSIVCLALVTRVYSTGSVSPSPSSLSSSLHLLRQNDLNCTSLLLLSFHFISKVKLWITVTDASNHASTILIEPMSFSGAQTKCGSLNEDLLDINAASKLRDDLVSLISYVEFRGDYPTGQAFWIAGTNAKQPTTVQLIGGKLVEEPVLLLLADLLKLPALCSQSAPFRPASQSDKNPNFQVAVSSGSRSFTGFRDQLSFRFLGMPFANPPGRWEFSTVFSNKSATHIDATNFGSQCWQAGSGPFSEDCLFLNVFTSFLPTSTTQRSKLRPVLFWIHGGAFTSGTGADSTFDGGAIVSRGDLVVVTINYRLTTLGFLSLNDGIVTGNYGLQDQITALKWVQQNIAAFGGDPDRVTIFGQSAGAASVRALISSPLSKGLYSAAIPMSNLMGLNFATQFSNYFTPAQEVQLAANPIIKDTGCANSSDVVACLKAVPPQTLIDLPVQASFLVADGTVLPETTLSLNHSGFAANIPTLWGHMRDDGAAFIGFPVVNQSLESALTPIISTRSASVVARPDLFPVPTGPNVTLNLFNVTARVATDVEFRCLDQATAVAAVKNKIFSTVYFYSFFRSYQTPGFDPNAPVCDAPKTPTRPFGDPNLPFFHCHSGELYYTFGTLDQFNLPFRDDNDLFMSQITMDYWLSFAWNHNPNPSTDLLTARGYKVTLQAVKETGTWEPVNVKNPTLRLLTFPVLKESQVSFLDQTQCDLLGFPLTSLE